MRKIRSIIGKIMIIVGVCCLLYPSISNWYNGLTHRYEFNVYNTIVKEQIDYKQMYREATYYNQSLVNNPGRFEKTPNALAKYNSLLNVSNGMMGYVKIPKIKVEQPIYHGTEKEELSIGVGHYFGSSLPIGGSSTHCVLSGHTGMSSQIMFSDLDKLEIGDEFYVTCLNTTRTYEVDQIKKVLPTDLSDIQIEENKEYCTLVTCTPLGVGSHRLLVRGHFTAAHTAGDEKITDVGKRIVTTRDKINWTGILLTILLLGYLFFAAYRIIIEKLEEREEDEEGKIGRFIVVKRKDQTVIVYKKDIYDVVKHIRNIRKRK